MSGIHIRVDLISAVTIVVALVWASSYILRVFRPDIVIGPAVDALATVVVGGYFTARASKDKEDDE